MAKNQSEKNLFWQGRQLEFASVEKKPWSCLWEVVWSSNGSFYWSNYNSGEWHKNCYIKEEASHSNSKKLLVLPPQKKSSDAIGTCTSLITCHFDIDWNWLLTCVHFFCSKKHFLICKWKGSLFSNWPFLAVSRSKTNPYYWFPIRITENSILVLAHSNRK